MTLEHFYNQKLTFRLVTSFIGHGKTKVTAAKTFPSKVTTSLFLTLIVSTREHRLPTFYTLLRPKSSR